MGFDEETEKVLRKWTFTDAAAEYIQLQDRIEKAIEVRKLGEKIVPAAYAMWATNNNISLPDELTRAVKARSEIPDWKAQYEAASHECDALKRELEELRSTQEKKQDLSTRERSTVKRLIIGMAIRGYKYNPKADRNLATKEIADDLELLGISLDVDTVRKWLKESTEELPSDWQNG
jgi:DNA repair ATPase RecN